MCYRCHSCLEVQPRVSLANSCKICLNTGHSHTASSRMTAHKHCRLILLSQARECLITQLLLISCRALLYLLAQEPALPFQDCWAVLDAVHKSFEATTINHSSLKLCEQIAVQHRQGCSCFHHTCLLHRLGIMPTRKSWYAYLASLSTYMLCRHHRIYRVCNISRGMLILSRTLLHGTKASMHRLLARSGMRTLYLAGTTHAKL